MIKSFQGYVMSAHPVIKTPPYHTVHLAINLKCQIRLAAELLYKSLVMPVIVILFHCCNFFCKITAVSAAGQCVIAETDTMVDTGTDDRTVPNHQKQHYSTYSQYIQGRRIRGIFSM